MRLCSILFTALILVLPGISTGTVIDVPADVGTIQGAIDLSTDGDTVLVAEGQYSENIIFNGKRILLTSEFLLDRNPEHIFNTIIHGGSPSNPDTGSVVRIVHGEDSTAVLQGFTLTGGTGTNWIDEHGFGIYREGGGILITLSSPIIQFNRIVYNDAYTVPTGITSAGGGGIRVGDGNPIIRNNVIMHNRGRYGAGIVLNFAAGVVRNNVIAYNTGGEDFGGSGIWKYQGTSAVIENNTIAYNVSSSGGGGVYAWATTMSLYNNIVWGNQAPTSPQIRNAGSTVTVSYCDVQGGYAGTSNIDIDPLFLGELLYLHPSSGCIDAGDPGASYDDTGWPSLPGTARWPSHGTLSNDIGAYGGQGAYPFEFATAISDVDHGHAPLNVSFQSYSYFEVQSWSWDFADGVISSDQHPMHTFETGGVYDVTVTLDTGGGSHVSHLSPEMWVIADTMGMTDTVGSPGELVRVDIIVHNTVPLRSLQIPFSWAGNLELKLEAVSTTGLRSDFIPTKTFSDFSSSLRRATYNFQTSVSQPLPPGNGPVLSLSFRIPAGSPSGVNPIVIQAYDDRTVNVSSSRESHVPVLIAGSVVSDAGCCLGMTGNVNNDAEDNVDLSDLTSLVNHLFVTFEPLACPAEANVNGDETCNIDLSDLTMLVNHLFVTFDPLLVCRSECDF